MHKKILRMLSLVLAIMLFMSALPVSAGAADNAEVERINKQIRSLYRQTLRGTGLQSLHGWCGTMVNWQLYFLGINDAVVSNDGNTQYNFYASQDYTSGGYRVRLMSASDYSLKESLNALTYDGTRDVYNVVLGFERTSTAAGRRYGHTLLIHAIIDGIVYFSESFAMNFHGTYYPEGAPIACTIDQLAAYYDPWTQYEGLIYFGLKTYAESCTYYPAYLYAAVTQDTALYTAPCAPSVDDRSQVIRSVTAGERMRVIGMYENTEGEFWYQIDACEEGYIRAEDTRVETMCYDDITVSGIGAPNALRPGKAFDVKGKIKAKYNEITAVRAQVFTDLDSEKTHIMSASTGVGGLSYSLSGTRLSNDLAFRQLSEGAYRYELAVVVGNHFYADGCLQTEWKTIKLWASDFQVVQNTNDHVKVIFDAAGGNTELNAVNLSAGDSLGNLPRASREGYTFAGWYTADGQLVTGNYTVNGNETLYARWIRNEDMDGWYQQGEDWIYYVDGQQQTGFVEIDGITYYLDAAGYATSGWLKLDGKIYYFHANGAMHTGWLEMDGNVYYMRQDGSAATGWVQIESSNCYFDGNGVLRTQEKVDNHPLWNPTADLFSECS